jgi:hypothetical protein
MHLKAEHDASLTMEMQSSNSLTLGPTLLRTALRLSLLFVRIIAAEATYSQVVWRACHHASPISSGTSLRF